MRLADKYRPTRLSEILGQPCVRNLEAFVRTPYPTCILCEGPSGCGKTSAAEALGNELGCHDGLFPSVHVLEAANFDADSVRSYLTGPWGRDEKGTPFRFAVKPKFHVLVLEELEYMNPTVQRLCKTAFERGPRQYRLIIVATSNDTSKLPAAVRDRFGNHAYYFSGGPTFATAINEWLPKVWAAEVGEGVDLPFGWRQFGWQNEEFSARRALDTLGKFVALEQQRLEVVA
jgi:replication-associated recombination protein RarA